ncbi:MAG: acetoacetate decarboxylase family protein [Myxococcales bacterium]|nr:acetoacetate decarboxylase family protein [Myxococcales bacterium]
MLGTWLSRFSDVHRLAGGGEAIYPEAYYLAADLPIDADAARRWLPWPLRPTQPARATFFTAWFPSTSFGSSYREAGVFVHVVRPASSRPAVFSPWMIVDDDVALIFGRELLGYPKKLGKIEFEITDQTVEAHASRRGHTLIEMSAKVGRELSHPPPIIGQPHVNMLGSVGLRPPWLVAFTPRETPISVREVELDLRIQGSERDPLHLLRAGTPTSARLHCVSISASAPPIPVVPVSPLFALHTLPLRCW